MEDVLEVYQRTYADDEILVCLDETSKQHIKETRTPLPARPGEPEKYGLNMNVTALVIYLCFQHPLKDGVMSR